MPLEGGAQDVTGLTGIRMWVRADQSRELRFEMDSPFASAANGWMREGWFVDVTEEATQVEVLFEDADIPFWGYDQGNERNAELQEILGAVMAILFSPRCVGQDTSGFLPEGTTDDGFVEIDNFEFF